MCEIAYLHIVAYLQRSCKRNLAHDTLHKCGLSLAVLADESHFLTALDGKGDVVENCMRAIILAHLVADNGIVATAKTGWKLEVHLLVVDLVDLNGHDLLQLLDAALHLHGLGGLVAETLYEVLNIGDFFLLILIGAELVLAAFGAEAHKLVVGHLIVHDFAAGDFHRAVGHVVDKGAVVAHEHHRAAAAGEEVFEPAYALDVEVVGRFVEQQHVGAAQQELCQFDAHAPAAGKLARGAVEVGAAEAEALQRALHFGTVVNAAHELEAFVLVGELFHELQIFLAFIVGAPQELLVEVVEMLLHLIDVVERLFGFFDYGVLVGNHHHLRQIAHGDVALADQRAGGRFLLAGKDFQKGGFTCAVLAHKGDAVFLIDDKRGAGEQRRCAKRHGDVFC